MYCKHYAIAAMWLNANQLLIEYGGNMFLIGTKVPLWDYTRWRQLSNRPMKGNWPINAVQNCQNWGQNHDKPRVMIHSYILTALNQRTRKSTWTRICK